MLKHGWIAVLAAAVCLALPGGAVHASPQQLAQGPAYAKWGRLAVQLAEKRYPQAKIVDYLHVGRQQLSPALAQEIFKLWLKEPSREFGVYVRISFDTTTERVKTIDFQETSR